MPVEPEALQAEGAAALERGDWTDARRSFEGSLEQQETPEALMGLSEALWWLGETDGAVRYAERAYASFRRRSDAANAVLAAVWLYLHYRVNIGNAAAARGWLGRASRLVDEHELAPLEGWVLLLRGHDCRDPETAARWTAEARDLARRFGDPDLELCALSQHGASLVELGRIQEGMALLDEAMAASLGGEYGRLETVVYTSCNMISACSQVAELERAAQWVRAADEFSRRYGAPHLYTTCRVYYGDVLFATGDWAEAERQLVAALDRGRNAERLLYSHALARLAELRLAQGRIDEAERLLAGFEDDAASAYATAAVRLARGEPAATERVLRRRLRAFEQPDPSRGDGYRGAGAARRLEEASLLELLVTAELARGAIEEARATAERLLELSESAGCEAIVGRALRASGQVHLAGRDPDAVERLEEALAVFVRLDLPFEVARTHLLLARATADGDAAVEEARAALAVFESLGAARDADAAAAFLRALGVKAARGGGRETGALTKREEEVLDLLAEGLSNRELAARLFVTRKTVEHHVRSVLRKLGLRSRAEAAAYAVRRER